MESPYQTVTQRYYTPYYRVDEDRERRHDLCLLVHSNRVSLMCLAPSHPIIEKNLDIDVINCEITKTCNRKSNKAVGKGKKGGQNLDPTSILCFLEVNILCTRIFFGWNLCKLCCFYGFFLSQVCYNTLDLKQLLRIDINLKSHLKM